MSRWYPLEPVDEAFFSRAPYVYRYPVEFRVPPERVWQSLTSDESISAWGFGVQSLRWTSPRPFGVGTTREVVLPLGVITVRERFIGWEEGRRYTFQVVEANRPVLRRFAEDYVVEPVADGSRLTWTVALEPTPKAAPFLRPLSPVNRLSFGQLAAGARRYFARHP